MNTARQAYLAEMVRSARKALVATGYFTEDQVTEDIAPRIIELNAARRAEIEELRTGTAASTEAQPVQEPPRSPKQHYAIASNLLRSALGDVDPTYRAEYIALANAHAALATVPQAQYDAWHREESAKLAEKQSNPPGECVHGQLPTRCGFCHRHQPPELVCDNCGRGSWQLSRIVGSRCDLPGCTGLMVKWGEQDPNTRTPAHCCRCNRLLFVTLGDGAIGQPSPARTWKYSSGGVYCADGDPAGCQAWL